MTRCIRFICGATGALVALTAAGCGSASRALGGRSGTGGRQNGPAPGGAASFVASVDVHDGRITFQPDRATTAGKARTAAQQYGPNDRLSLTGSATFAAGVLTANVTLTSSNTIPLNDARVVVTGISDSSINVANPDGSINMAGASRPYWDHTSLDPGKPTAKVWKFSNPGGVNFTFRVTVLANIWSYSLGDGGPNIAISFADATNGFLVGSGGKLLATKDGGVTWQSQNPGTTAELRGIYFPNAFDGWLVGVGGVIRHTGDGGHTWQPQTSNIAFSLNAVRFVGAATGWAVGENGTILKTTDAGNTWTRQAAPTDLVLYAVDFADANVGWVVGQGGTILHTVDGGNSWSLQSSGSDDLLESVTARSATTAWACGANGRIVRTTDGASWSPGNSGTAGVALTSIFFINNTTGWAVGAGNSSGIILKSTDGGLNWNATGGSSSGLFYVRFTDASNGWAVGQAGTLLRSTDGGDSWTTRSQGAFGKYYGVDFPTRDNGWLVGEGGIRATADGGQHWTTQYVSDVLLQAVRFVDPENGWAVGTSGRIVHTADGGATWIVQDGGVPTVSLLGVDFVDTLHGCVVGTGPGGVGSGTILYTADGGATWQSVPSPARFALNSVDMVDPDVVYAVGSVGTVAVTFDASLGSNATWNPVFPPTTDDLHYIRMIDENNGWIVGGNGRILHTADGSNWDTQRIELNKDLWGIDFQAIPLPTASGQPQKYKYVGWAVGVGGRVLRTTDAGKTWGRIDTGTLNTLRAFRYTDLDSGWAVGDFGTVQRLN